jgi:hypothetical protein
MQIKFVGFLFTVWIQIRFQKLLNRGNKMTSRKELVDFISQNLGAQEIGSSFYQLHLNSNIQPRTHVIQVLFSDLSSDPILTLVGPIAKLNEITAEDALRYSSSTAFGVTVLSDCYALTSTFFYEGLTIDSIQKFMFAFASAADKVERDLGLGDKF